MDLIELTTASVVFTTREGGISKPPFNTMNLGVFTDDDPVAVARNIRQLRDSVGLSRLHWLRQVHGATLLAVDPVYEPGSRDGDGLIVTEPGVGAMVVAADCYPVALAAEGKAAILHCGWRGLAAGIVERGLAAFDDRFVEAAVGPGIGQAAYAVGSKVMAAFGGDTAASAADGTLDLRAIIVERLTAAGVERIEHVEACTFSLPDRYFSHRWDGGRTGRQGGVVWLR